MMPGLRAVSDAQPIDYTRTETFDHHISGIGQGEEGVPAPVILEVDHDPAHAAVTAVGEEPRIIGGGLRCGYRAQFDHQRAVVGQQARATGGWSNRRKVEDGDPLQRSGG